MLIVFRRAVHHYRGYLSPGSGMAWKNTNTHVPRGRNPLVSNITPDIVLLYSLPPQRRIYLCNVRTGWQHRVDVSCSCAPLLARKLASGVCKEIPGIALIYPWHSAAEADWSIKRLAVIQEERITLEIEVNWKWGWNIQSLLKWAVVRSWHCH